MLRLFLLSIFLASGFSKEPLPLPRFVSLKSAKVNSRVGPGLEYPYAWTYTCAHLPVEIIAEFETWRKIRDADGKESWVHQGLISGQRYVLLKANHKVYKKPNSTSKLLAIVGEGNILHVKKYTHAWCYVDVHYKESIIKGWLKREHIYGIYDTE